MAVSKSKSKIMRDHEMQLALIKAFSVDPELKYFLGMAAGAGVAWVGTMLNQVGSGIGEQEPQPPDPSLAEPVKYWFLALGAGLPAAAMLKAIDWQSGSDGSGGLSSQMGNILALGGVSFAGTCAMILILKAIFSGTDLGEMLSGVGEIMPL